MLRSLMRRLSTVAVGAWIVTCAGACVEPTVAGVAAWLEGVDDGTIRELQVYDHGRRFALELQPDVAGSGFESLGLAVDPRGRGLAVSGERSTQYFGLADSLQPRLTAAGLDSTELSAQFAFTRNADALLRWPMTSDGRQLAFLPTTTAAASQSIVLDAPLPDEGLDAYLITAANAPVMLWSGQSRGSPPIAAGLHVVLGYPSDVDPHALSVEQVTELGSTELLASLRQFGLDERWIDAGWCPGRVCISPEGRSVVTHGNANCTLRWWRWQDGPTIEDITLEGSCPEEPRPDPGIIAQIDHDLVVLDDAERVYLADLSARTVKAAPKLWDAEGDMFVVDRGHVVVLVTSDARVTRIDADGPRVISARAVVCPDDDGVAVVSPNGYWVVRTCLNSDTSTSVVGSLVTRVSPLGTEVLPTVAMTVLMVDNEGNALLFSHSAEGVPRGLFVLASDGKLRRIDSLEPQPGLVRSGAAKEIYFSARASTP